MDVTMEENMKLLYLAKKYDVGHIVAACHEFIKEKMNVENAVFVFNVIQELGKKTMELVTRFVVLKKPNLLYKLICKHKYSDHLKCTKSSIF